MRFRLVIGGIAALLVLYVIFWFVLAHVARVKIADWIETQRTEGIEITYDRLDIGGFPYRLQVEVRDLKVAGREGELLWSMESPNAAAVVMPWNRNHVILMAEAGALAVGAEGVEPDRLSVSGSRASIVVNRNREPLRLSATAGEIRVEGPAAGPEGLVIHDGEMHWRAADQVARRALAETQDEEDPREPLAWQLALRGNDISHEMLGLSPYGQQVQKFATVFEVRGSGIDNHASPETIQAWRDQGGTIEVTSFEMKWGALDLLMTGSLTLDQQFRPLGAFTAEVKGYEPIISYLRESGHIDAAEAETATMTLEAIVAADTDADNRLSVPVTLQAGRLFVGPLPVANLPSLLPVDEPEEPEPAPTPEPEAAPTPEPEAAPTPEADPKPDERPAPETAPAPDIAPAPETAPAPEAVPAPEAAPAPEEGPVPDPDSAPQPDPEPQVDPEPQSAPEAQSPPPAPQNEERLKQDPAPEPGPAPEPSPTPEPSLTPELNPAPPAQDPAPEQTPEAEKPGTDEPEQPGAERPASPPAVDDLVELEEFPGS